MTYVRNAWYVAAWAHDVVSNQPMAVCILNEPIVLWRNPIGEIAAFEDRCIHRFAPLSLGRCEGERLRCMYHGVLYDRAGTVVEIPGQDRISSKLRLRTYPVIQRYGWVWLWMGTAAAADESLIPPVWGFDHPDYVYAHGQLDYVAEARLVNENLLDLSHSAFLHAESFRTSESWARERPHVTQQQRYVRSERWFRNEGRGGTMGSDNRVDSYFRSDFYVPGILHFSNRAYSVGTADALDGEAPDLTHDPDQFSSQAVTPLTDKSARYFFLHAVHRREGREPNTVTRDQAFAEDKEMIEAQQRNVDLAPGRHFIPTLNDQGAVLFQRLVDKLAKAEAVV